MVGLVIGGLVLLGIVVVGGSQLAGKDEARVVVGGPISTASQPSTTLSSGPSTTVLGSGAPSSLTTAQAAAQLEADQQRTAPDLAVGTATCPPEPYRVGHAMICSIPLEGTIVSYRVEVTGDTTVIPTALRPVIDTRKAAELVEAKEAGAAADCGLPRVRQVDVGSRFSCTTATSTWDFTVKGQEGQLSGVRR